MEGGGLAKWISSFFNIKALFEAGLEFLYAYYMVFRTYIAIPKIFFFK